MASTLLTPTAVTREALRILHQKCTFIGSINRQYDDSFAKTGAKIGSDLKIRLPNKYTVRTGKTLDVQDTTESSVTLSVASQAGVDMNFSSEELTMDLDNFSKRIIDPAMAVLAAHIENDVISNVYKDVYNQVNKIDSTADFEAILNMRKSLTDNLAPAGDRNVSLHTTDNVELVDALKGLFQDSGQIAKQYRDGYLGRTAGFDWMENTHMPSHTTGTETNTLDVNGATESGSTITVTNGSSKTLTAGDIITIAGCNRVHPETKADTGVLQTFVVTEDLGSSGTSLKISPAIVVSGPTQNVSGYPTNGGAITKHGGDSAVHTVSLGYHKDAFTFATADLLMPSGVDFARREVLDGISMRIVRQYDINNDNFPCRLDVLYGYKTLRPETAVRLAAN